MRVGIVAAMKPEMEEILNEMEDLESVKIFGSEFHRGYIGNVEVVLTESGMGKVNAAIATTILIREFECSFIINTGIAGATKPLKHRDVIIAESLAYHDVDATIFGYKHGQVPGMPAEYAVGIENIVMVKSVLNKLGIEYKTAKVYSGDQFVSSMDAFKYIENTEGIVTEMEGAGVAQTCVRAGVDFIVLRYISDVVGEENQEESYIEFENDMAHDSATICIKLLKNLG
ncbi:MAG: 5'-methylthioadenosine/adenosylhomocysteine nucleosidase [Acholeplasmatales bacterium]|nr:5'-methylthioadenosine/adenosylhomocysteine nucleosidase [Acholeplasmatales bacterium]